MKKMERPKVGLGRRGTDRKTGAEGRVMFVNAPGRFRKRYLFATHGLTPAECVARVRAVEASHAVKCATIERMQAIAGVEWVDGAFRFRLSPATVRDRGDNVELVLMIRRAVAGAWKLIDQMPLRKVYRSVAEVPTNEGIEQIARAIAADWAQKEREQEQFAAEVALLLGD